MPASIEETTLAVTNPGYTSGNLYQNAFRGVAGYVSGTQAYTNALVFHLDAGLSNELKAFTRDALNRLDAILRLHFQEASSASDPAINFLYRIEDFPSPTLGAANTRVRTTTGSSGTSYDLDVTVGFELSAGVALNAYPSISDATAQTILHEMGHSLGLDHPNGDGWAAGFSTQDTLMSYYWTSTGPETPFFREADIRALVSLWGSEVPLTPADWFVQVSSGSGPSAPSNAPVAGGGGGGGVVIPPRDTSRDRSGNRRSSAASTRGSRDQRGGRTSGLGGESSSRTSRTGRSNSSPESGRRNSRGSLASDTSRSRLMAVDPITNPERLALQPMMQEVHSATTRWSQGSAANRADWLSAWNQQLQAPEWAARTQLETALPTNWL